MTQYNIGRGVRRQSSTKPFCARCGNVVEDPLVSPGRASWTESGRGLSLEIDGREGRQVRRRHSSANLINGNDRRTPLHCYIIPASNGTEGASTPTSTYRESFRSPSSNQSVPRQVRSTPSSPVSTLSPWSVTSSSSPTSPQRGQVASIADVHSLLSRLPARRRGSDVSLERNNTTYRDHFTWIS